MNKNKGVVIRQVTPTLTLDMAVDGGVSEIRRDKIIIRWSHPLLCSGPGHLIIFTTVVALRARTKWPISDISPRPV